MTKKLREVPADEFLARLASIKIERRANYLRNCERFTVDIARRAQGRTYRDVWAERDDTSSCMHFDFAGEMLRNSPADFVIHGLVHQYESTLRHALRQMQEEPDPSLFTASNIEGYVDACCDGRAPTSFAEYVAGIGEKDDSK